MSDVYIDPASGNDSTGDGSTGNPYASIQGAYNATTPAHDTTFHLADTAADVLTADINHASPNNWSATYHAIVGWDKGNGGYGVIDGNGSYRCTGNAQGYTSWNKIEFTNGNTSGNLASFGSSSLFDCKFSDTLSSNFCLVTNQTVFVNCLFENIASSSNGSIYTGANPVFMHKCIFKEGTNSVSYAVRGRLNANNCIFWLNGGSALWYASPFHIANSVFYQQSSVTGSATLASSSVFLASFHNCYFEGWTYALRVYYGIFTTSNLAFYNNTTDINFNSNMHVNLGGNKFLTSSGLTDPANGDFTPKSELINAGYPTNFLGTDKNSNLSIGAWGGAAAGGLLRVNLNGGM